MSVPHIVPDATRRAAALTAAAAIGAKARGDLREGRSSRRRSSACDRRRASVQVPCSRACAARLRQMSLEAERGQHRFHDHAPSFWDRGTRGPSVCYMPPNGLRGLAAIAQSGPGLRQNLKGRRPPPPTALLRHDSPGGPARCAHDRTINQTSMLAAAGSPSPPHSCGHCVCNSRARVSQGVAAQLTPPHRRVSCSLSSSPIPTAFPPPRSCL
jgi:hypothetical protein